MNDFDIGKLIADEDGLAPERRLHLKENLMNAITLEEAPDEVTTARERRRSKTIIATGVVAGLAALGGVAAAAGLFPSAAESLLPGSCRDAASVETLVASDTSTSGRTVQMFTTQTDGQPVNGAAVIEVGPDGEFLGGGGSCGSVSPDALSYQIFDPGEIWVMGPYTAGSDGVFMNLAGGAPADAASVRIDLSDGTSEIIETESGGYFLAAIVRSGVEVPAEGPTPAIPEPVHVVAFDQDGNLIAEVDL